MRKCGHCRNIIYSALIMLLSTLFIFSSFWSMNQEKTTIAAGGEERMCPPLSLISFPCKNFLVFVEHKKRKNPRRRLLVIQLRLSCNDPHISQEFFCQTQHSINGKVHFVANDKRAASSFEFVFGGKHAELAF